MWTTALMKRSTTSDDISAAGFMSHYPRDRVQHHLYCNLLYVYVYVMYVYMPIRQVSLGRVELQRTQINRRSTCLVLIKESIIAASIIHTTFNGFQRDSTGK